MLPNLYCNIRLTSNQCKQKSPPRELGGLKIKLQLKIYLLITNSLVTLILLPWILTKYNPDS